MAKKVYIVTWNDFLLRQLEDKKGGYLFKDVHFVSLLQISDYLNEDCVVLMDEYYWALTHTEFKLDMQGNLPAVFTLGMKKAKLIAYTGSISARFKAFFGQLHPSSSCISIGKIIQTAQSSN